MKTGKKMRVSFSDNILDVTLPTSWQELSQKELATVFRLMSGTEPEQLPMLLFSRLANMRVLRSDGEGFICLFGTDDGKKVVIRLEPMQLEKALKILDFINSPGDVPVRLDVIQGRKAVNAELHGVSFGSYISLENYYQGYISTKNPEILSYIAKILYPGEGNMVHSPSDTLNLLNWLVQIKTHLSESFPNFFKPVTEQDGGRMSQLEIMNNEIRALTGGDVTKEDIILASDCWRALTELDFKAKEAAEYKNHMAKNH